MNPQNLRMNDTIKERPLPTPGSVNEEDYSSHWITQSDLDKLFKSNKESMIEEWDDLKKEITTINSKLDLILKKVEP